MKTDYTEQIADINSIEDFVLLSEEIQVQINDKEFCGTYTYSDTDDFITSLSRAERLNFLSQVQDRLVVWLKNNLKKAKSKK